MEPEITYSELKFPSPVTQTAKKTAECKQPQPKTLPSRLLVALLVLTSFLLLMALIALIILYSQASKACGTEDCCQGPASTDQRLLKDYQHMRSNYSQLLRCAKCKNESCVTFLDASTALHCGLCPDGWRISGGRCYLFSTEPLSWEESRNRCLAQQADLLIVGDKDEQSYINNHVCATVYWIGLTDRENEGEWKWVNGSVVSLKFWLDRQPDNANGAEDCATAGQAGCNQMLKSWNDDHCDKPFRYICEKEAETSLFGMF
ncbi:CD209 antigen-like protein E [Rhinatrema bivittatum]|uniref:CD209 antigen-like protein E n=1 Tax=Rhinatrema bivittatum TaxID=194408 RepID=UPI001129D033|nr:CD209 antigen-like protein E [Rhinatrema bivittatum]